MPCGFLKNAITKTVEVVGNLPYCWCVISRTTV